MIEKLVCSICGYTGNQKKFKFTDINKHFDNAKEIWCPTNKCIEENKNKRIIPNRCVKNCWYEYCGWYTIEEKPKVVDLKNIKSIQRARQFRDMGIQILKEKE